MKLSNSLLTLLAPFAAALFVAPVQADYATWISDNEPAVPAGLQDKDADPDGDGIPNVIEYLVDGLNPAEKDAALLPQPTVAGDTFSYSVPKRAGVEDVTGTVLVFDGTGSQWVVASGLSEDADFITVTETVGPEAILARIAVQPDSVSLNPIETAYPEVFGDQFQWTADEFAWEQEFDVTTYGAVADGDYAESTGTDNWGAFNDAMRAAASWAEENGKAAIVRIPAGVYFIGESLLIPPGVVLRGDDPAPGEAWATDLENPDESGANPDFDPPSKLVFPKYEPAFSGNGTPVAGDSGVGFKRIYSDALAQWDSADPDPVDFAAHARIGLVNLDINRAGIILDTPERNPIKDGGNWSGKAESLLLPPFLNEGGIGQYFIVFGIKSNNAAVADGADGVNSGVPNDNQNAWQRNPWRFNASIRVVSGGHALIANNQCNYLSYQNTDSWGRAGDPDPVYVDDSFDQDGYLARADDNQYYPLNGAGKAVFRHSNQYGISVNGLYFFAKAGKQGAPTDAWGNGNGWYGSPTSAPWLFREGHAIVDNWIYTTIGGKIEASGTGLVVSRNVLRDALRKSAFTQAAGVRKPSNGSAFLSRGMLLGGSEVVTNDNDIITTKHNIGNPATGAVTSFVSNDGEGIMIDNTTTPVNGWTVDNNRVNSNIFAYKTKGIDRMVITNNIWINPAPSISSTGNPIWADADPNDTAAFPLSNSIVDGNQGIPGTVIFKGTGGSDNVFTNNIARGDRNAKLSAASTYTDTSGNEGFTIVFE